MNSWAGIGRLTKDPVVRKTSNGNIVSNFIVAINRGKDSNGEDRGADYISVTVFGRQAENCERYLSKGLRVAIQGHIQTGSYKDKNGNTVYTTDVIADRVEFLEWGDRNDRAGDYQNQNSRQYDDVPGGFMAVDGDGIPF